MSIIATVTSFQQIGVETYIDRHISREFDEGRSIRDILSWAKNELGVEHVSICDVRLSEYTGKSL